ncbi:unnamed protein product [Miscanthus lutarioriparius]|uniref:Uncharacterized protein n=1 Tax=Miscanthus lutarioriparius TaxID=422564 RepID=A0A811PS89_9POAL|nr:unnamed protein product [Miscanthus lutarioriparius]
MAPHASPIRLSSLVEEWMPISWRTGPTITSKLEEALRAALLLDHQQPRFTLSPLSAFKCGSTAGGVAQLSIAVPLALSSGKSQPLALSRGLSRDRHGVEKVRSWPRGSLVSNLSLIPNVGGISSWRIAKLNHGYHMDGTDSMADMMATLNIFYSLIIFQGAMFLVLLLPMYIYEANVVRRLQSLEQLSEKWGEDAIGRRTSARLLGAFVNKGEDVSWVLLPSRHRIQRLIDSLMISNSSRRRLDEACVQFCRGRCYAVTGSLEDKKEIRELAAMIVADVAAHIDDLSNYPGAMRCISSLFQDPVPDDPPLHQQDEDIGPDWLERRKLMMDQQRMAIREHRHRNKREGGRSNQLVQQGLTILERLASNNDDNRRIICSTPGLLPKITAPVYSATLIEDVKNKAWADIVTRCLKVLYQLIRAPDGSHEIFSNNVQALSNLKSILELGNNEAHHQELKLVAMEILTELALDLSINLTEEIKKVLVTKQLQLFFLANGDGAAMAGRTLVSLSANRESNSALIMTTQDGIIGRLTRILDGYNITRRTIAAEIMANLYAHCNVDSTMKEILPKVLGKIMSIKTKSQQRKISAGENNPAALGDEENQGNFVSTNNEERQIISTDGDHTETEEISDQEREEQEAFLSLAHVICDKLDSADLDGAIQIAVQNENNAGSEEQRREAFVEKLKTIIDDNRHATADCLRIVKLCGQIAKSVMLCEQYVKIFRNKGFKSSLSEASKTMSELESCMLFAGTDFGLRKTVKPLFSEIEKTWSEM